MGEDGRAVALASMCSLNLNPGLALATIDASVALRTASGSRIPLTPGRTVPGLKHVHS
jgi:hypothetical protein